MKKLALLIVLLPSSLFAGKSSRQLRITHLIKDAKELRKEINATPNPPIYLAAGLTCTLEMLKSECIKFAREQVRTGNGAPLYQLAVLEYLIQKEHK